MEPTPESPAPPSALRRWFAWIMVAVLVASVSTWYFTRERLPAEIRIATGAQGGLYYRFGSVLGGYLEKQSGHAVRLLETQGSRENAELIANSQAELAILQGGSTSMDGLAVLAPLYREPVFVIVRKGRGLATIHDLTGHKVALGVKGSGMRESARLVLSHYRVDADKLEDSEHYFLDLLAQKQLDAAIVTTGLENPDLIALLGSGEFDILPIEDATALATHHPFFVQATIPRGLFSGSPAVPDHEIPTAATTALLVTSEHAGHLLVEKTMEAYFENPIVWKVPSVLPRKEALDWPEMTLHPAARAYHEPYAGIGILANFMESIAAFKELLFALFAGLYLLWDRQRKVQERNRQQEFSKQKERLDVLLLETVKIEKAQMTTEDPAQLNAFLDEVTRIKLRALDELTHEDLRGDQFFAIFLAQCANLIRKLQTKMLLARQGHVENGPKSNAATTQESL